MHVVVHFNLTLYVDYNSQAIYLIRTIFYLAVKKALKKNLGTEMWSIKVRISNRIIKSVRATNMVFFTIGENFMDLLRVSNYIKSNCQVAAVKNFH